jgi:hypothetical protein
MTKFETIRAKETRKIAVVAGFEPNKLGNSEQYKT